MCEDGRKSERVRRQISERMRGNKYGAIKKGRAIPDDVKLKVSEGLTA